MRPRVNAEWPLNRQIAERSDAGNRGRSVRIYCANSEVASAHRFFEGVRPRPQPFKGNRWREPDTFPVLPVERSVGCIAIIRVRLERNSPQQAFGSEVQSYLRTRRSKQCRCRVVPGSPLVRPPVIDEK